jgi:hypothetical protein
MAMPDWRVSLQDHHPGYIRWEEFLHNQERLEKNRTNGEETVLAGPAREGLASLQGLLLCGHCDRPLTVRYTGNGGIYPRYQCNWFRRPQTRLLRLHYETLVKHGQDRRIPTRVATIAVRQRSRVVPPGRQQPARRLARIDRASRDTFAAPGCQRPVSLRLVDIELLLIFHFIRLAGRLHGDLDSSHPQPRAVRADGGVAGAVGGAKSHLCHAAN